MGRSRVARVCVCGVFCELVFHMLHVHVFAHVCACVCLCVLVCACVCVFVQRMFARICSNCCNTLRYCVVPGWPGFDDHRRLHLQSSESSFTSRNREATLKQNASISFSVRGSTSCVGFEKVSRQSVCVDAHVCGCL